MVTIGIQEKQYTVKAYKEESRGNQYFLELYFILHTCLLLSDIYVQTVLSIVIFFTSSYSSRTLGNLTINNVFVG